MARSCGLRIGPRRFELVVIDGSPKKHKITSYLSGELPRGGAGDEAVAQAAVAAALKEALKGHNLPRDNVGLVIDTGFGAFRTFKVPFTDRAKIEEVLKFEVESLLPQWSIDDVIVDFHVQDSTPDSSELLITAVPKQDLRRVLSLCEKAGIEPQEAELETTAMVNAALGAGLCPVDSAQILVHIGVQSTSVVVVDAGKVREMRAIHIGALSHEIGSAPAEGDAPEEGAEKAGEKPPEEAAAAVVADPLEVQRRLDQAIRRITRELGRTISAARTAHPIQTVYVCGYEIPDLVGSVIQDVPVKILDAFEKDGGQPAEGYSQFVVAYGAAVRQLGGGVLHPSLRREELRYSGAFERVELPLAVVCLLLLTLLGVWNIFLYREATWVDGGLKIWRDNATSFLVGNLKKGQKGYLEFPSKPVADYVANYDADTDRSKFEQLQHVRALLVAENTKLEKELGQDAELTLPQSALSALTLVLDVLDKGGQNMGRPSLRKIRATYQQGKAGKTDTVRVVMDLTIFANGSTLATQNFEAFKTALASEPWFAGTEDKPTTTLDGDKGIYVEGFPVTVDVTKALPPAAGKN